MTLKCEWLSSVTAKRCTLSIGWSCVGVNNEHELSIYSTNCKQEHSQNVDPRQTESGTDPKFGSDLEVRDYAIQYWNQSILTTDTFTRYS